MEVPKNVVDEYVGFPDCYCHGQLTVNGFTDQVHCTSQEVHL